MIEASSTPVTDLFCAFNSERSTVTGLPELSTSTAIKLARFSAVKADVLKLKPWSAVRSFGSLAPVTVAGTEVRTSVRSSRENFWVFLLTSKSSTCEKGFSTPYLFTYKASSLLSVACCRAGFTWSSPTYTYV